MEKDGFDSCIDRLFLWSVVMMHCHPLFRVLDVCIDLSYNGEFIWDKKEEHCQKESMGTSDIEKEK